MCYAWWQSAGCSTRCYSSARLNGAGEATPQPLRACAIYNIEVAKGFSNLIRLSSVVPLPIYVLRAFIFFPRMEVNFVV